MLPLLQKDCTRVLDTAIAEERKRYAAERIDFHSFFEFQTVRDIQRIVGSRARSGYAGQERAGVVRDLLDAQQQSPHRLWTLLLLQAFEAELVLRRREISLEEDIALDNVIVETFIDALSDIPESASVEGLRTYVLRLSRQKLRQAMRGNWRGHLQLVPAPPVPSAVTLVTDDVDVDADKDDDASTPTGGA